MPLALIVYVAIFSLMVVVWVCYRISKNPAIVDVAWSLGLMLAGLIYLFAQTRNTRTLAISGLLIIWSLRLATYLFLTRVAKGHVDKRYLKLSDSWKIAKPLGFFLNFQLQGVFIFILATVFYFAGQHSTASFDPVDYIGFMLVIMGIYRETTADYQLSQFKKLQPGKVCNVGLWQYSRHPNYFFDWLTWCGFTCYGLSHPFGCIGLISPLLLYILMTRVTGPMTEQGSIESRGQAYLDYQRRTSMFFPWFARNK